MSEEQFPANGIGVAIIERGKILLTKRRDFPVWCIPGGHLSPGELILDTAVREVREETGLVVSIIRFVGFYSLPHKEKGSWEVIVEGRISGGKLKKVTNETCDARYFSIDELPSDLVGWQYHQAFDALTGKSGGLVILETELSLRQLRKEANRLDATGRPGSIQLLTRLCKHPKRYDLSDPNQS